MGPPLAVINVVGTHDFTDTTLIPGWLTQRYRAVAWGARDDILGLVEARSVPTPQVSVLVPPPPPVISGLAGNQPLSTATDCLVGWTVSAATPPNTRCIVEVRPHADLNQMPLQRVPEGLADAVPIALSNDMPSPETGAGNIYALAGGVYRAWVKRPTADATMVVTLKVKDSLGRMTRQTVVVEPLPAVPAPVFDPINWDTTCEVLRGSDYKRFYFKLEPVRAGDLPTIWGTDTYTDDSAIGVAALHAGRITRDGGHVAVEIRPAQQSYQGTTRNGVTSTAYGPWHGSYVFIGL
ncbi:MAG: hypothetical protein H7245_00770 [Candidatus Saccharibacteria bacterium]|nr:hypothetical protein [Pseudorhodobacter sp.]